MPTPTPVLNARERLIKSIEHWIRTINDGKPAGGPQVAAAVAADLFGDPLPDIAPVPGRSSHIGPIGHLGLWFALVCEETGIMRPGAKVPPGIMVDLKLLIPLLALHPTTFEDQLYHPFVLNEVGNVVACSTCYLVIHKHFEAIEQLHMAEIESLRGSIEIMEATTDIQMQAIQKQTEEIEAMTEAGYVGQEARKRLRQNRCTHSEWSVGIHTDSHRICSFCGYDLDCPHDKTTGNGTTSLCNLCGADRTEADYRHPADYASCLHLITTVTMDGARKCEACGAQGTTPLELKDRSSDINPDDLGDV